MKKRRMLFMREQAERKDLTETSVNNTVIENESGLLSLNQSFKKVADLNSSWGISQNKGVRESSMSNLSEIS